MRKNSNKINLFSQALKDIGKLYRDVGGYDMSYDYFKQYFRKSWEEEYNHLCIDISKKRDQARYCICIESKDTNIECIFELKPF